MFELLLFIGMSVLVSFTVGLIAGYAGLCQRRVILDAAKRECEMSGR